MFFIKGFKHALCHSHAAKLLILGHNFSIDLSPFTTSKNNEPYYLGPGAHLSWKILLRDPSSQKNRVNDSN